LEGFYDKTLFVKGPAPPASIVFLFPLVLPLSLFAEMSVVLFILQKWMKAFSFSHISVYKFLMDNLHTESGVDTVLWNSVTVFLQF